MHMELFCYTENHIKVVYDPIGSHAATHFADVPELKKLVKEVLEQTVANEDKMWFETDMGRPVGISDLVETDETDEIVYAKRVNRHTYTRFTKSRKPQPSSIVTVAINKLDNDDYILKSAWIGEVAYSFPDEVDAVPESRDYWNRHALVWGTQEIQPGTETTVCPWGE